MWSRTPRLASGESAPCTTGTPASHRGREDRAAELGSADRRGSSLRLICSVAGLICSARPTARPTGLRRAGELAVQLRCDAAEAKLQPVAPPPRAAGSGVAAATDDSPRPPSDCSVQQR